VRSEHFGRCDCFTVVDCSDADIRAVDVIDNPPHSHGGCLAPVDMLAAQGVDTLVVQGIGARPYAGLLGHGIMVLRDSQAITVGGAIDVLLCGSMPAFDASDGCQGHD
jgi:predicted Fe-Mo cluster-binding NifX family protein